MVYPGRVEKFKKTYDLDEFKAAALQKRLRRTSIATQGAAQLGIGTAEIAAIIQTIQSRHFYKSMTTNDDHRTWQDVYHVPSDYGVLYIKFQADATPTIAEFVLLSFKEK